jgi:nucleoside-triphosphatase THEP1
MVVLDRLTGLIAAAGLHARELVNLTSSPTSKSVIGMMANRCGFGVEDQLEKEGFDVFRCEDVCVVGIPIPGPFAVVCVRTSDIHTEADAQCRMGDINQTLKHEDLHVHPVICIGDAGFEFLLAPMQFSEAHITPLSIEELVDLLLTRPPRPKLLKHVVRHTPLKELNPYVYKGPVSANMFIGRHAELHRLMDMKASYALIGPRTIGKSSLVQRAVELVREEAKATGGMKMAVLVEFGAQMSELDLIQEILRRFVHVYGAAEYLLGRASVSTLERLLEDLAISYRSHGDEATERRRHEILIIIDEADAMPSKCPRLAESLRKCHNAGWAKVVLVGFKTLRRALNDVKSSPLMNVCQELPLDSLSLEECGALIMEPMQQMDITFENMQKVVEVLHAASRGAPSRVQLFCHHLVNGLDGQKRRVTSEMARDVVHLPAVQGLLRQWYKDSTSVIEKWLAGVAASCLPCDESRLYFEASRLFPELTRQQVDVEISDLVTANVLTYERDGRLTFTIPLLADIVRPEQGSRESHQALMHELRAHLRAAYGGHS